VRSNGGCHAPGPARIVQSIDAQVLCARRDLEAGLKAGTTDAKAGTTEATNPCVRVARDGAAPVRARTVSRDQGFSVRDRTGLSRARTRPNRPIDRRAGRVEPMRAGGAGRGRPGSSAYRLP